MGGSVLVAGLGLHLPAAIMGRGWGRTLASGGAMVTALGILGTGTRGAWIAGLLLVMLVLGVGAWAR